jgi:hypothetical protein
VPELSRFQIECEKALIVAIGGLLYGRKLGGKNEAYIYGQLPNSELVVYIYKDSAEVLGGNVDDRFESCDYNSLDDLQETFVRNAVARMQREKSAH